MRQSGQLQRVAEAALPTQFNFLTQDQVNEVEVAELVGFGASDRGREMVR